MGAEETVVDGAPASAGEQLKRARESLGFGLPDVAAATRIPERHLRAIEEGDFASLPGRTYAIGFARTYARLVGLDADRLVRDMSVDYRGHAPSTEPAVAATFTPGDPARVPSKRFAWAAAGAALLLAAGGVVYWQNTRSDSDALPSLLPEDHPSAAAPVAKPKPVAPAVVASAAASGAPAVAAPANGPVVFTSDVEGLWVKFYDGAGNQLLQKMMHKGETYTVPADAKDPKVRLGMGNELSITIGGKPVAKLTDKPIPMKDVPVSAAALLARTAPAPVPAAAPTPAVPAAAMHAAPKPHPHVVAHHAAPSVAAVPVADVAAPVAEGKPSTVSQ